MFGNQKLQILAVVLLIEIVLLFLGGLNRPIILPYFTSFGMGYSIE